MNNRDQEMLERFRREQSRPKDLPPYDPGDEPGRYGRRVARLAFEKIREEREARTGSGTS